MAAQTDVGLMFLDKFAHGARAHMLAVPGTVADRIPRGIMGNQHQGAVISGPFDQRFQPFGETGLGKFRRSSEGRERGTAHAQNRHMRRQLPHFAVQVDAFLFQPVVHFRAIHVADLGQHHGVHGLNGLDDLAGRRGPAQLGSDRR